MTPLRQFEHYTLLGQIAEGGMGVVYQAVHRGLNRSCALKLIRAGLLATPDERRRFVTEAEAAAKLDHPHIVRVGRAAEFESQWFLEMELVESGTLADRLTDGPLPAQDTARLLECLTRAVQHAHERGILHRDLKPGNVLLAPDGQPKLTDFGLARFLEKDSDLTRTIAVLGTPAYMAPELASGRAREATIQADVYSLGVILFECLTGQRPFQGQSPLEILRAVQDTATPLPSSLRPDVPLDLETICLKCLEKNPAKRYPTAQALADEFGRFLRDEPIQARPIGRLEKAWRWCRRKPALAGLSVAAILLLVAILTSIGLAGLRNTAVRKAEQREYFAGITLADNYVRIGDIQRALETLTNCPPVYRHWEWGRLMYLCHQEIETIATVTNQSLQIVGGIDYTRLVVNADRSRLVTVGEDGAANVWDLKSGVRVFTSGGSTNRIIDMAFAPTGRTLALLGRGGAVEVWDASAVRKLFECLASNTPVQSVSFNLDGTRIRVTSADAATVWDAQTGQLILSTPQLPGRFLRLALAPDETRLATLDAKGKAQVWDTATGQLQHTLDGSFNSSDRLFLSANGRRLLMGNPSDGPSTVWNTGNKAQLCFLPTRVDSAAFSADGSRVAIVSRDNVPRVRSTFSGREILALKGHGAIVRFVAFSADSSQVTTASEDGAVKTWRAELGREYIKSGPLSEGLAFSPDGKRLAIAQDDNLATVWDVESGQRLLSLEGHLHRVNKVAFSADGRRLVTSSFDKTARVWDTGTGQLQGTLRGHTKVVYGVAISPDGRYVASCGDGVRVWDIATGGPPRLLQGDTNLWFMALAFSPDGRQLATSFGFGVIELWNHKTGERLRTLRGHTERVLSITYSPDGRKLATAGFDKTIQIWDPGTGKKLRTLRGHLKVYAADFSLDGKRLITATAEHMENFGRATAQIWDVEMGRELIILEGHTSSLGFAAFSPDGRRAATCDWNGVVRLWEAFPWRDQEYPGGNALSIGERAELYARDYWKDRLAVDAWNSRPGTNASATPRQRIDRSEFPARAPQTPPELIDLTEHYNGLLNVSWIPAHYVHLVSSDLTMLPTGLVQFADVSFDVRGLIQLQSPLNDWLRAALRPLPERAAGIRVGRRFARLHALLGAIGKEPDGTPIGSFLLHYADGSAQELEINYGQHVRDWWTGEDPSEILNQGSVVWKGKTTLTLALGGDIRVFASQFVNSRLDMAVERIDFVSRLTRSGPFLIALTVEP